MLLPCNFNADNWNSFHYPYLEIAYIMVTRTGIEPMLTA